MKTSEPADMIPANKFHPPPVACERLATICTRAGGTLTMRPGAVAERVDYALPAQAKLVAAGLRPRGVVA